MRAYHSPKLRPSKCRKISLNSYPPRNPSSHHHHHHHHHLVGARTHSHTHRKRKIFQMHPAIPTSAQGLSSVRAISGSPARLFLTTKFSGLSLTVTTPPRTTTIRMGGGPRTYPGGVSKWQWKRMQAKKAKQLLKARLSRERQIYEMRKRAELKAAVSELERPWEVVQKAPKLFSVSADEQLKVLADRFQKPGGFDMWSEKDGPELFKRDDGLPSARFFPKGVVHSIKPYGKIENESGDLADSGSPSGSSSCSDVVEDANKLSGKGINMRSEGIRDSLSENSLMPVLQESEGRSLQLKNSNEIWDEHSEVKKLKNNKFKKRRNRGTHSNESMKVSSSSTGVDDGRNGGPGHAVRELHRHNVSRLKVSNAEDVYDLRLQPNGSYEFQSDV